MLFLTKWFGVTESEAERHLDREQANIEKIVQIILGMQASAAAKQRRSLGRGTHAKGVCVRAEFEVLDVAAGRDPRLAARLVKGIYTKPATYPAMVRFANSDPSANSDFKADVRSLSFSVELPPGGPVPRQDYSMQAAPVFPMNDLASFLSIITVVAAERPLSIVWPLPFKDKRRFLRALVLAQMQAHQRIKPYQQLRYWSGVPFRHGTADAVKYSATPHPRNHAQALSKNNPNALQDELIRHVTADTTMSSFDFGLQFLDTEKMTYWGKRHDADFWIENASIKWNEAQSPFHTVARLRLLPGSHLPPDASESTYIDVTENSLPDSIPLGSINRARWPAEVASRKSRMQPAGSLALALVACIGMTLGGSLDAQSAPPGPPFGRNCIVLAVPTGQDHITHGVS